MIQPYNTIWSENRPKRLKNAFFKPKAPFLPFCNKNNTLITACSIIIEPTFIKL